MNIVAIGGGKKRPALKRALERANNTDVLVVPSACSTEKSYNGKVPANIQLLKDIGARSVEVLHGFEENLTYDIVEEKVVAAGLLFMVAGNTPYMMKKLREHGSDMAIRQSVLGGRAVLAGASAGALVGFRTAQTQPEPKPEEQPWDYAYEPCLNIVPAAVAVHANQFDPTPGGPRAISRHEWFLANFPACESIGFSIENGAALEITDSSIDVIRSDTAANVHLVTRIDDIINSHPLEPGYTL